VGVADDTDKDATSRIVLARYRRNPVEAVRELFGAEPDLWQAEALMEWAKPSTKRLALKACKGPGKTTVLAWMILIFLLTRSESKIAATSITGDNLGDNLWPEIAKWLHRSKALSHGFKWTKTRIVNKENPENWFATARTWPKTADAQRQADTLAGLHADHMMFLLDESGGIPQAVMATAEAILASGIECKIVQAGNPTHLEGPLYRAVTIDRALWVVITITGDPDNPKRSPRIDIEWARQQIATYGRDNPWVMVNVLGEFPPSSINALLGSDDVEKAMARIYRPDQYAHMQKRLGVDVARFGDDRSVIFPRQGLCAFKPVVMRNARTTDIAARVARAKARWGSEVELIDDTGHWGHGVLDQLDVAGTPGLPIVFHEKALNPRYKNRRAEMWIEMSKWVKKGGKLPSDVPELIGELITPTYTFHNGQFLLEEKDQIKERIGRSPDLADALALTFAIPDQPGQLGEFTGPRGRRNKALTEFDPYEKPEDALD
jgi:phage terminase large subunit